MVSVNKISLYVGIPLLSVVYLSYVLGSFFFYDDQGRQMAIDSHYKNIEALSDVNSLILGGSNAAFSLSAEMLTNQTQLPFYNASIVNEGFSAQNYFSFIDDLFSNVKAKQIELVLYSSYLFVRSDKEITAFRSKYKNIIGQSGFPTILPEKTFARFLIDQLKPAKNKNSSYGNVTQLGDFVFEGFKCEYDTKREGVFKAPSLQEVMALINERMDFVKTKFPNARIAMVFPLEYDPEPSLRNQYFNQISEHLKAMDIDFIIQKSTQDPSLICDAKHHTNDKGRAFRTNDLLAQILESL